MMLERDEKDAILEQVIPAKLMNSDRKNKKKF